ncbi:hypothetical protein D3C80_1442700 [compost metagenome]
MVEQRTCREGVQEGHGVHIRLYQRSVRFVGAGPVQLHRGNHVELLEAGVFLGVDHLQVGDGVRYTAVAITPGLLDAIERLAHGAVADRMHMHQPATGIGGADQLAKVLRVQQ